MKNKPPSSTVAAAYTGDILLAYPSKQVTSVEDHYPVLVRMHLMTPAAMSLLATTTVQRSDASVASSSCPIDTYDPPPSLDVSCLVRPADLFPIVFPIPLRTFTGSFESTDYANAMDEDPSQRTGQSMISTWRCLRGTGTGTDPDSLSPRRLLPREGTVCSGSHTRTAPFLIPRSTAGGSSWSCHF